MAMHAARYHGVRAVGVTLSRAQADRARRPSPRRPGQGRVEIRLQDYRDVRDGPSTRSARSACSSTSGCKDLGLYFRRAHRLLRPGGRMLNHGISRPAVRRQRSGSRPPVTRARPRRNSFVDRYVFPDGELHGSRDRRLVDAGSPASRSGTSRAFASTTRSRSAHGCGASRTTGTRLWPEAIAPARIGACTWPPRRSTSRPAGPRSIRSWPCGAFAGGAGCAPAGLVTGLSESSRGTRRAGAASGPRGSALRSASR